MRWWRWSQKQSKIVTVGTNRKSHTRFRLVPKLSTLDDLQRPWMAKTHSVAEKMRLLEPTAQIWIKIDPYYQQQTCRPMTLVSGNIGCMRTFAGGSSRRGPQMRVGLSTTAIFGDLNGYFFGNFRYKASNIMWQATPCRLVTDCKMNDLEWPWVAISCKTRFSY